MPGPLTPSSRIGLVALVTMAAFFAVRLPILLFEPDWGTTEMDQFGLFAAHLVSGLLGPPADYLPQPHQGCTFVFGAWCAPVIALAGPEVGSLRLCSLTLHAAVALVFTLLASRAAGWKGAASAGALFVLAPPMLAHYAQKGSTNHDDCDLFVGLALLLVAAPGADGRGRGALVRAGLAGALVGLAAGYMLDGGVRGAVVLGLALVMWSRGRLARGSAMAGGLLASLATFAVLGVSDGEDGVIRKAFSRGTLWAEDRSGIEMTAPFSERLGQLIDFALPTGFRVSGPDLWGLVPMSEGVLLYAYPALLLVLAVIGGIALTSPSEPTANRGLRLVQATCVLVPLVQCSAVLFAGLEVEVDYIAPIWPYLVVLAASAFAPGAPRRRRVRTLAASIALGGALLLCFEGMHWKLAAFYFGASDEESNTWLQSRFAGSLRAARPERHTFGPRLIDREGPKGLRQLAKERPEESPALLRMLGQATALDFTDRACGPEGRAPGLLGLDLAPAERAWFFEGLGEQVAMSPEPCRMLHGGPSAAGWDAELGAALRGAVPDEASWMALLTGIAYGTLERLDGRFGGLEQRFAAGVPRRALCVASGQWAWFTMRPVELMEWLDPAAACTAEELALGWGMAVGRDLGPGANSAPTPEYRWWWPDAPASAARTFACGFRSERDVVSALATGGRPESTAPCLPAPTPPPPAHPPDQAPAPPGAKAPQ
ncbi:MAG: hypothetical protein KDA24_07930 [Deltaproteobacteria bacterium]|nr:hypothetical protein [Deltaproteobacteria bacterium]